MRQLASLLLLATVASVAMFDTAECRVLKHTHYARALRQAGSDPACVEPFNTAYNTACTPASAPDACCSALAGVGSYCLQDAVKSFASVDPNVAAVLTQTVEGCSIPLDAASPGPSPIPVPTPTGPTPVPPTDCPAAFNDVMSTTCDPSSAWDVCCPSLSGLGADCLHQAADFFAANNATLAASFANTLQTCAITLNGTAHSPNPNPVPSPPVVDEQQCKAAFGSTLDTACTETSSVQDCCAALAALGTGCLQMAADWMAPNATVYATFTSTLQTCGITLDGSSPTSPSPSLSPAPVPLPSPSPASTPLPTPTPTSCEDSFNAAVSTACSDDTATSMEGCCTALAGVGGQCLTEVVSFFGTTDPATHDKFVQVLQSCGIETASPSQTLPGSGSFGSGRRLASAVPKVPRSLHEEDNSQLTLGTLPTLVRAHLQLHGNTAEQSGPLLPGAQLTLPTSA